MNGAGRGPDQKITPKAFRKVNSTGSPAGRSHSVWRRLVQPCIASRLADSLKAKTSSLGGVIIQLALFCSNSVIRCRNSRNSPCICVVALPTKKKHIGRNAKKAGRHQPESGELMEADKAMREMKAQKAAGIQ